ncbi:MAG: type II secretion system secretin GspD, partial [Pseudomonadota bacterium]
MHSQRWWLAAATCLVLCALQPLNALAQTTGGITPNYKQADIRQIIEAVSAVTGKNFVIDPRVKAEVTMLSSEPMTPDAFYETFISILEVYGFVAVPSDGLIKIIPNANVRQMPGPSTLSGAAADDIITQVIEVKNVGATQLVPILRPLVPQYGHLAAHAPSNMLIISDRAANVQRLLRIIRRIDQTGDEEIEVVPLQHASAGEIVRIMQSLAGGQTADGNPAATNLVADERTNSVLIGGERSMRLRLRALIAHLDTPLEDGGNMQVRYLHYANATELAEKLQAQFTTQGGAGGAAQGAASKSPFNIWADEQTNALIITAPPKVMRSVMGVVDKIDIRRAQVLVEAIIVEVTVDNTMDLGISWAAFDDEGNTPFAATDFPGDNRRSLSGVAAGAAAGEGAAQLAGAIGTGITMGLGRIRDNGVSFAAIVSAFAGDGDSNIISTPTIVTMDNEEARIEV